MVDIYWVLVGVAIVLALVLIAFVIGVRRWTIRKALALPGHSRLGKEEMKAFHAFENTDIKLAKNFPHLSAAERKTMAQELLRSKGRPRSAETPLGISRFP